MKNLIVFCSVLVAIAAVAVSAPNAEAQGMGGRTTAQLCPPAQNGPVNLLACNDCQNANAGAAVAAPGPTLSPAEVAERLQAVRVGNGPARFAAVGGNAGSSASSAASSGNGGAVVQPQLISPNLAAAAPTCERRRPVADAVGNLKNRIASGAQARQASRLAVASARQGKPIAIAQAPAGGSASASAAQ